MSSNETREWGVCGCPDHQPVGEPDHFDTLHDDYDPQRDVYDLGNQANQDLRRACVANDGGQGFGCEGYQRGDRMHGGGNEGRVSALGLLGGAALEGLLLALGKRGEQPSQKAVTFPLAVVTVTGAVGWVAGGQVIPRAVVGKLPEDGFDNIAIVSRRAAAGGGRRLGR